jgi:hypothetical protein
MRRKNKWSLLVLTSFFACAVFGQSVPSKEEKIPFACTFSKDSDPSWGDDDFVQSIFFVLPENIKMPFYIRVFDPDVGGKHDENHNDFNSKTKFSVYGGKGAHSDPDAKNLQPVGNFRSGSLLATKTFSSSDKYDNAWYTFGPFNPGEGELQKELGGRVFKFLVEGLAGDDGNLYRVFLSSLENENVAPEGCNAFAYEYTFRLEDRKGSVAHLYPFVPERVTSVKLGIFDYDNEGMIRIVSVSKKGDVCQLSQKQSLWTESRHRVSKEEINTSLDVQFIKQFDVKNNNIAVSISNQYGEAMPFYTYPIGGIPKYNAKIGAQEVE